ncbi:tannase/feruloyl esterase family alpha/beta hydrolase, partial [Phenylobacterium sp.]|uniref:tannase/feruloyl esterase family alpha/beta hydrolase n=1 Tax=Phenylobacterium sp. TaxID=1871053 RepID=UPI002733E440
EGVIAGAPAFANRPLASMTMAGRAFADPASKPSKAQISLINDSVLAACDANDGLKDGLVTEPLKCAWDPKVLACKPGRSGDACLTPAQVAGVRAVYQDHHAADGTLVTFGLPKGSELSSYGFFVTPTRDIQYVWGMHHQAAGLERDADLDLSKNDPVANYAGERNALSNVLIYSENPDISPFMRRGGKLLMWTGTYDQLIPARSTYDYFEAMRRVTDVQLKAGASKIEVTDRTRLFTAVGVSHCGGGAGPGRFDALSALEAWVEKGEAPSQLVASDPEGATPRRSRPMCQHPTLPRYKGGDPNSAASFTCG